MQHKDSLAYWEHKRMGWWPWSPTYSQWFAAQKDIQHTVTQLEGQLNYYREQKGLLGWWFWLTGQLQFQQNLLTYCKLKLASQCFGRKDEKAATGSNGTFSARKISSMNTPTSTQKSNDIQRLTESQEESLTKIAEIHKRLAAELLRVKDEGKKQSDRLNKLEGSMNNLKGM